ncbi:hypothetical protein [Burkholderia pseudomallei]|uniref:hypothetical protein n=1 Tax=Burkholderia pseudomallei TaxID=28450 RepID=UPI0011780333|nr:hypothetical protein [Burkholderia pseudomallei]
MNVRGALRAHSARGRKIAEQSRIAHLNWFADLHPRLVRLTEPYTQDCEGFPHRFFVSSESTRCYHFQFNAVSTKFLRPVIAETLANTVSFLREEDACLVYSMHQNGTVIVTIYPHSSEWAKWEKKSYVVDFFPSPAGLSGSVGDKRIRKHIALFLQVAHKSMAVSSVRDNSLIEKLAKANDRYERIFATRSEARRAWADAQVALGAGLLGGLVASTILPFAQTYGAEKRGLAAAVEVVCKKYAPHASERACYLAHPHHVVDHWTGEMLSTGNLLILALVISFFTIRIMVAILRQR